MPTPKTDGKLSNFTTALKGLIQNADSDLEVKRSEDASASVLLTQQLEAYLLARETAYKYADIQKGLGCPHDYVNYPDFISVDFAQYLKDATENQAKLEAQNEVVGTALATAIASIKDAAAKLQTLIKDTCNLKSTAQLESSLFNIADDIKDKAGEIAKKAGDSDGPGEYAEFAFNAAVKTAGIQALIGLGNLGDILADVTGKYETLKSDVETNLAGANENLNTSEGHLLEAGAGNIDKAHDKVFSGNHKNALKEIMNVVEDTKKSRALNILRRRITSSVNGAQPIPSATPSPSEEEQGTGGGENDVGGDR